MPNSRGKSKTESFVPAAVTRERMVSRVADDKICGDPGKAELKTLFRVWNADRYQHAG